MKALPSEAEKVKCTIFSPSALRVSPLFVVDRSSAPLSDAAGRSSSMETVTEGTGTELSVTESEVCRLLWLLGWWLASTISWI